MSKGFRVDTETWATFEKACKARHSTPAEMLREILKHVDAAISGIESGAVKNFDGDVARLIHQEFPQLSPFQLTMMGNILIEAAIQIKDERGK